MPRRLPPAVYGVLLLCCGLPFWGLAAQDVPKPSQGVNRKPAARPDSNASKKDGKAADQKGGAVAPADRQIESHNPLDDTTQEDTTPVEAKEQPFAIEQPHSADSLQGLWFCIMGISSLSMVALGFTAWRLRAAGQTPAPSFESLVEQVNAARQQASRARSRYDDLASRASRPAAPRTDPAPSSSPLPAYLREPQEPRPQTPYTREPQESRPSYTREPQEPRPQPSYTKEAPAASVREPFEQKPPVRLGAPIKIPFRGSGSNPDSPPAVLPSARSTPPAQAPDELVEAYHVARTSPDRNARDQFDSRYPYVRISCINHDEWQFHKNITLRFQASDFGWYLMVSRGGKNHAFPWFTQDLAHERESFKGVFQYPEGTGDTKLRLVRPAQLQPEGEGWVLTAPGEVQADV